MSLLYEGSKLIAEVDKPTYIYYFGDYDPSGLDIADKADEALRLHAPDVPISFIRGAVIPKQVEELGLPTTGVKKSDSRSKN